MSCMKAISIKFSYMVRWLVPCCWTGILEGRGAIGSDRGSMGNESRDFCECMQKQWKTETWWRCTLVAFPFLLSVEFYEPFLIRQMLAVVLLQAFEELRKLLTQETHVWFKIEGLYFFMFPKLYCKARFLRYKCTTFDDLVKSVFHVRRNSFFLIFL